MNAVTPTAEPLSCTDYLPLAWLPGPAKLPRHEADAISSVNQQVLAAVAAIEERHQPVDEEAKLENEVARLHQKVDILLELVSTLVQAQGSRPRPTALRLSSMALTCESGDWQPGEGMIELYLHRATAQPLRLPAVLAPRGSDGIWRFDFEFLDQSCTAALERHVFLHHRRSVAEARLSQKR